jgi:RNA polymerase sigma-70 factor (ECF subfamily)
LAIGNHPFHSLPMNSSPDITQLLKDWSDGDGQVPSQLMPLVYQELRRLADHYMSHERVSHTLQPTALVNEAYLRLIDQTRVNWQNRAHFFGIAAQLMRRILLDHARAHHAGKRGGVAKRLSLEEAAILPEERASDLIALDEALEELAKLDDRKSRIVELRFFGGLGVDETAEVLGIHRATVLRDWSVAKAWLHRELSKEVDDVV